MRFLFEAFCRVLLLTVIALEVAAEPRRFAKFWNNSLVFPSGTDVDGFSLSMLKRAECVSWCVHTANCCCTQWVQENSTCTILTADRAGLSNGSSGVVSSIDSTCIAFNKFYHNLPFYSLLIQTYFEINVSTKGHLMFCWCNYM